MPSRRSFLSLVTAAAAWRAFPAYAQERHSPFVGSNPDNVRRMVELAAPRSGETVIDLGSGDGRIVFAALQSRPGVRGLGVDINAELVQKSNAEARAKGLADRVQFMHQNAFDADLVKADVIFMWLFPELMRPSRPTSHRLGPTSRDVRDVCGRGEVEHLRQHERVTEADREVQLRVESFHIAGELPRASHLIAAHHHNRG